MNTSRPRTRHAADIRRHDDHVLVRLPPGVPEQHRRGVHVVDRYVEEPLYLVRVQIDGQQPIDARARNHVRHQFGGNRHARGTRPAILARIAEVRHHGGYPLCRRPPAGVGHQQQFHQIVIRRRTCGLHDEDIAAAHIFHQFNFYLAVAESPDIRAPQRHVQVARDLRRERRIGISREHRDRQ